MNRRSSRRSRGRPHRAASVAVDERLQRVPPDRTADREALIARNAARRPQPMVDRRRRRRRARAPRTPRGRAPRSRHCSTTASQSSRRSSPSIFQMSGSMPDSCSSEIAQPHQVGPQLRVEPRRRRRPRPRAAAARPGPAARTGTCARCGAAIRRAASRRVGLAGVQRAVALRVEPHEHLAERGLELLDVARRTRRRTRSRTRPAPTSRPASRASDAPTRRAFGDLAAELLVDQDPGGDASTPPPARPGTPRRSRPWRRRSAARPPATASPRSRRTSSRTSPRWSNARMKRSPS